MQFPQSHERVLFRTGTTDAGQWWELPDTENTETYLRKLSFASTVTITYATGEYRVIECGRTIKGGLWP